VCHKQHEEKHKTDTPGVSKCLHGGCNEAFFVPKDLMAHMKQHKTECDVPGCLFTSKLKCDLHVHRKKVHSIWPHICQLCGKGFESNNFKRHMKRHDTGEPGVIKCTKNKCKQTFISVADFKTHLDNHESIVLQQNVSKVNSNKFECQLCGKILKGHGSFLQTHLVKHETETPGVIKCIFQGCKQTFTSASDLKQHAAKHWDVSLRPLVCDFPQCNYASNNNYILHQHKRKVHSSNVYTCDMCGRQFKHLSYIARHIRKYQLKQLSAENPKSTVERQKTTEEFQVIVCKDEIEEVIFD
jgi:KRAB domain-containing zinc finger protein